MASAPSPARARPISCPRRSTRQNACGRCSPRLPATLTGGRVPRRVALGYQAGLSLAVRELIGHAPGACPRCRVAPLPSRTRLLLALLGAPEAGGARLGLRALQMPLLVR